MKLLLYFAIFTSTFGSSFFGISTPIGVFTIFRITVVLMIFAALLQKKTVIKWPKSSNKSIMFMLLWLFYSVLTALWVKDYSGWAHQVFFLFIAVITIFFFVNEFKTIEDIKRAIYCFIAGAFVQEVFGWIEFLFGKYYFLSSTRGNLYSSLNYPVAMLYNTNDFATLMFFVAIISLCLLLFQESVPVKCILAFNLASCISLITFTSSRGNIISLAISVAFILLFTGKKRISIFAFLMAALLFIPGLFDSIYKGFDVNINATEGSDAIRSNLIKNGFIYLKNSFGFGIGAGQIEYYNINEAVFPTRGITSMHNWWMEILTCYGIPIFIGYVTFYLNLFKTSFIRIKSSNKNDKYINLAISTILIGYIIASVSSSSNMTSEYLWVFWAICIANQCQINHKREKNNEKNKTESN